MKAWRYDGPEADSISSVDFQRANETAKGNCGLYRALLEGVQYFVCIYVEPPFDFEAMHGVEQELTEEQARPFLLRSARVALRSPRPVRTNTHWGGHAALDHTGRMWPVL